MKKAVELDLDRATWNLVCHYARMLDMSVEEAIGKMISSVVSEREKPALKKEDKPPSRTTAEVHASYERIIEHLRESPSGLTVIQIRKLGFVIHDIKRVIKYAAGRGLTILKTPRAYDPKVGGMSPVHLQLL
jgi:hypothetical protein